MGEPLAITIKTLTPLWTGGVGGTSDRLHATGIIGSLRWWYEAIVRGMGGYVCDPVGGDGDARCEFDTKAYEELKRSQAPDADALQAGLKALCPVSYLFGATGWARLFQLQVIETPTTPLHFRTSLPMNKNWLQRVFGGESRAIDTRQVPYGVVKLRLILRGHNTDYAAAQFVLALRLAAEYGGLGARLQHGFGQVEVILPSELQSISLEYGLGQLAAFLAAGARRTSGPPVDAPFDLRSFFSQTYDVPVSKLNAFTKPATHIGNPQKRNEAKYLPCAFDLRYKGQGSWGMRRWLRDKDSTWWESDDPQQLGPLDQLLGPRSDWKVQGRKQSIDDNQRTASRVSFGMPYQIEPGQYRIRVFGFAPPQLLSPTDLSDLCQQYMADVMDAKPYSAALGADLILNPQGATQ